MSQRMNTYICKVSDPSHPEKAEVTYTVRGVSERHADRQARDGWCGLLGVPEGLWDRLSVDVQKVPGP